MITELYIDGQRLDLSDDIDIRLTYSITDIENPVERKGTVSRTIEVPGTPHNDNVFGSIYRFDQWVIGFDPSVRVNAYVLQNSIEVFNGIAQLLAVKSDGQFKTYEVGLYGENVNLFKQLGDSELTDLDFSELDHEWDGSNIVDAWFNSVGSTTNDYYYPAIDYGQASFTRTQAPAPYADVFNTEDFYPAIAVKKYVDKIISGAGFTYESDFLTSQWFKQLIVPYGVSGVPYLTQEQMEGALFYIGMPLDNSLQDGDLIKLGLSKDTPAPFFDGGGYDTTNKRYTPPFNGDFNIQVRVKLRPTGAGAYERKGRVYIRKNGTTLTQIAETIWAPNGGNTIQDLNIVTPMSLTISDYIEVWVDYTINFAGPPPPVVVSDLRIFSDGTYWLNQISGTPLMQPGFNWNMNETIVPKVKQSDFLMYLVRMFNLFIMPDKYDQKKLYIEPFSDFYDNSTYLDWTGLYDVEKGYEVVPCGYMNPKTYKFSYKDAGGYFEKRYQSAYQSSYGSRTYISSNEFSNGEQSEDVGFGNSVMVGFSPSPRIYARYYDIDNKGTASGGDVALDVKPVTPNLRILYHEYIPFPSDTEFVFEGTEYTSYPYAGNLDNPYNPTKDLCFGIPRELYYQSDETSGAIYRYTNNNLFNRFWLDYVKLYTDKDAKKVKLFVQLSAVDILNLDFRKPIYINGTLFYLLSVNDYDANSDESTSIELLKVLDLAPFEPTVFQLTGGIGAFISDEPKPQLITE
jgi:hypothetical protein